MRLCPGCRSELRRQTVRDTHIDGCSACGGVWFDKGELQGLANRQMDLWVAARAFKPTAPPRPPVHERICPSCDVRLEAFEYPSLADIELDRCRGCGGIWVDDGELDQIDVRLA